MMRALMLITGSGPLVVLTSYAEVEAPSFLALLEAKGIDKFIAYEIPIALARQRYGGHFRVVLQNLNETDDLRVLDHNGQRAFKLFSFDELGPAQVHEPEAAAA